MSTYFGYIFGNPMDIYDMLIQGFEHFTKAEYETMVKKARSERDTLKIENENLKKEIAIINTNIIANLERELRHMQGQVDKINRPSINKSTHWKKTVEQLDC